MNLVIITFTILVLACIIFLLMYLHYFRKLKTIKNQVRENFDISAYKPEQCTDDINNVFFIEDGIEIEQCYNYVSRDTRIMKGTTKMYIFRGEVDDNGSYLYIKDYFDNYVSIVLLVEFLTLEGTQTVIDTKFYKVEMVGSELKLTYKPSNTTKSMFNLKKEITYEISIDQIRDSYGLLLTLKDYDTIVPKEDLPSIYLDMSPEQMCDFSTGNDIYIGCTRNKTDYLHARIGIVPNTLKINKSKYDEYAYPIGTGSAQGIEFQGNVTIPSDLECDVAPVPTIPSEPVITQATVQQRFYQNYVEIIFENIITDLKLKYKESRRTNNTFSNQSTIHNINSHFNLNVVLAEEIYQHPKMIQLEKRNSDDTYFDGYDNLNESSSENYLGYFFDVNNTKNTRVLEKMVFIDLLQVKSILRDYSNVYMLILGEQTTNTSFIQFLKLDKPIFIIIFKKSNDISFEYLVLKNNLDKFYEYQKIFAEYIINTRNQNRIVDSLYTRQFKQFIEESSIETMSLDLDTESDTESDELNITYNVNFFRLYGDKIGFNMIMNLYENGDNLSTYFVNTFTDSEIKCDYDPYGETLYECKQICSNNIHCSKGECNELCNNCKNIRCKWNLSDIQKSKHLVPGTTNLRGFSGNTRVKLSWIRPFTRYDIDSYYIIHESANKIGDFDVYVYKSKTDLNEYIITNLENNVSHMFYIISKNKFGMSEKSNKVTLLPSENKDLKSEDLGMNSYSDSVQNYYRNQNPNINLNVVSQYNKLQDTIEINYLKEKLVDKLIFDGFNEGSKLNINVY